jgi:hypothetical protein
MQFSVTETTVFILCLNANVYIATCFSARNGGITVAAGIHDMIKETGRDTAPSQFKSHQIGLWDIKNGKAQEYMYMNLKEMQMFCDRITC